MVAPLIPILGVGAAGLVAYKLYEDKQKPELQSLRHVDAQTGRSVQVVVPVRPAPPRLSVTDVPIAGVNAQVIRDTSPGAVYSPPAVIKRQQVPGKLDLLPTVITATGAATLAVMTTADVQNALNTLGYGPLAVDGKVEPQTATAIRTFQAKMGLAADGNPGQQTKAAFQHVLANLAGTGASVGAHPAVANATASTPAQVASNVALAVGVSPKAVHTAQDVGAAASAIKSLFSGATGSGCKSFFGRDLLEEYEASGIRREDPLRRNIERSLDGIERRPMDRAGVRPLLPAARGVAGGRGLGPGQYLYPNRSTELAGGRVSLVFQPDGNLVLYQRPLAKSPTGAITSTPLWASGTAKRGIGSLTMKSDGELVIQDNGMNTVWSSGTQGNPGAILEVREEDAVIRSPRTGAVLWSASQGSTPTGVQARGLSSPPNMPRPGLSVTPPTISVGPQGVSATPPSATLTTPAVSASGPLGTVSVPATSTTASVAYGFGRDADPRFDPLGGYSTREEVAYAPRYERPTRRHVETVADVQTALNLLGASPPVDVTGTLDPRTVAATKAFQVVHGLLVDGFAGPKTKTALTLAVIATGQRSDFGLTLFTLFGSEPPCVGSDFGAGRRPAPPTGQMVGGRFMPAGGAGQRKRHRHHHNQQQQQDQGGGGGGGDSSGGGGGGDSGNGGGGGGGPSDAADDGGDDGSDMSGVGGSFG